MSNELVSIIMPSYNCGEYVEETIRSVQAQTYQNWEIIFVDDCSSDDSVQKVNDLRAEDKRIHIFLNKYNAGAAVSRNNALQEAKGRWIAFLDSDDLWEPTKLERQIRFMEEHNYAFSYTMFKVVKAHSPNSCIVMGGPERISKDELLKCCWTSYLTVMYDQEKIGLLQVNGLHNANDYALWLQVVEKADCYLLPECLATQMSGKGLCLRLLSSPKWLWRYEAYRKIEGLNTLSVAYMTVRNIAYAAWKWWKFAC